MIPVLADPLGPRGRRRAAVVSAVSLAALGLVVVAALARFAERGQLDRDRWSYLFKPDVLGYLWDGLANTLRLAAFAGAGSLIGGLALALVRLSRPRWLRAAAVAWLEFFRGLPLVLLILFSYFGLGRLGYNVEVFHAAALGLILYNSAIFGEIFRAGILSLERGQGEAALALGLTDGQAMRAVILPQALRRMIPAVVSQVVTLLKDTALAGLIGFPDLLARAQIRARDVSPAADLQAYTFATAVYMVICLGLSRLARRLEVRQRRRFRAGGISVAGVEELTALDAATLSRPDV